MAFVMVVSMCHRANAKFIILCVSFFVFVLFNLITMKYTHVELLSPVAQSFICTL